MTNGMPAPTGADDELDLILNGAYACARVWEAWGFGTMTEDDFEPLAESEYRMDLIAWRDAAVASALAGRTAPTVKTPAAPWNLPFILRADDETWTLGDSDGRTVVIARRGPDVFVVDSGGALRFEGVKRDLFARCFEAAGRSAAEAATTTGTENGQ